MSRFSFTDEQRAEISAAVTRAEAQSDGEVVTLIAAQSNGYHDVAYQYASLSVFLLVATVATWSDCAKSIADRALFVLGRGWHSASASDYLWLLLATSIALFLVIRLILAHTPLRIALTPKATRIRRVRREAVAYFRAVAEGRTRRKTAILIYASLAEHRAEIIGDANIVSVVNPELWGDAMACFIAHVKEGDAALGLVSAIDRVGAILATHVPRSADDTDELPDRLIEI